MNKHHYAEALSGWSDAEAEAYMTAGQWRDIRLDEILSRGAARDGAALALVDDGVRLSYADLDRLVDRAAAGLTRSGIASGDRILLQLDNRAEFVIAWFALVRVGAVPVHAMPGHRLVELTHLVRTSGAVGLVVTARIGRMDHAALAREVADSCPSVARIVVVGEDTPEEEPGSRAGVTVVPWQRVLSLGNDRADAARPASAPLPRGRALGLLLHSGGTTGLPKLIPRSHADYESNARQAAAAAGLDAGSVTLVVLPVAFNFAMACPGVLGTLHAGGTVVLAPDADPAAGFALVARERVTHVALTPTLARLWIEEAESARADLSSLRVVQVGGARLDDATARRLEPALGATLQQVFGMAEGLICMTGLHGDELRFTTQGRPISPADRIRVVGPDGREAEPGTPGDLETSGPFTIRRYLGDPEAHAASFAPDGAYRTGDVVRQLPSGHLVVTGRSKDQINRGGEKYAAGEVERYLLTLPGVRASAVVAEEDPDLGERAVAFLACTDPAPTRREVIAHLRGLGVQAVKYPDRVIALPELPLTAVGKIDKKALAALLAHDARDDAARA